MQKWLGSWFFDWLAVTIPNSKKRQGVKAQGVAGGFGQGWEAAGAEARRNAAHLERGEPYR